MVVSRCRRIGHLSRIVLGTVFVDCRSSPTFNYLLSNMCVCVCVYISIQLRLNRHSGRQGGVGKGLRNHCNQQRVNPFVYIHICVYIYIVSIDLGFPFVHSCPSLAPSYQEKDYSEFRRDMHEEGEGVPEEGEGGSAPEEGEGVPGEGEGGPAPLVGAAVTVGRRRW